MSSRSLFAVVALVAAAVSATFAQSVAPAPSGPSAPPPAPEVSPEQIFEAVGWFIADRSNFREFSMNETELAALLKGVEACARGESPPETMEQSMAVAQQFVVSRVQANNERAAVANRAEEEAFMATLDQNPAVKKTDSGLRYEIVEPGTSPKPTLADKVVAHYVLTFVDGTVQESSRENGEPAEFALNGVIPAWQEGMQLIGKGGRIKLYVPSRIGYGEAGSPGGIPPAKMLVFDVELVDVKPGAPKPAMPMPSAPSGPATTP